MNKVRQILKNSSTIKSSLFSIICGQSRSVAIGRYYVFDNDQIKSESNVLNLNDFECKLMVKDNHAGDKVYRKEYTYFDKNTSEPICYIQFEIEPNAGKICWLGVYPKYRRQTLCKQMLNIAKEEVEGKTNKLYGISGSDEIAAWFESHKDDPNIKKTDRGCGWAKYEINI